MQTVSPTQVVSGIEGEGIEELALPPSEQVALGELVNAAKDGLLALSVGVGLGVLHELMESEVDGVVGPKGRHNPDRTAVRHGHDDGEVTLGGRRVQAQRPRVRSADGREEVELRTYSHFAARDPLTALVLEQMLAGVSTRRMRRTRAGRRGDRGGGAVGVEVCDLQVVRRAHTGEPRRADGAPA